MVFNKQPLRPPAEHSLLLLSTATDLERLESVTTEQEYVRAKLATYSNDLISLGIDGFRLDAAKRMYTFSSHLTYCIAYDNKDINVTDIANIISRLINKSLYITQEV